MVWIGFSFKRGELKGAFVSDALFWKILQILDGDALYGVPGVNTPLEDVKDWQIERAYRYYGSNRKAARKLGVSPKMVSVRRNDPDNLITKGEPHVAFDDVKGRVFEVERETVRRGKVPGIDKYPMTKTRKKRRAKKRERERAAARRNEGKFEFEFVSMEEALRELGELD